MRRRALRLLAGDQLSRHVLALQQRPDIAGDALAAAKLVRILGKFAVEHEDVERPAVGHGEDLGVGDVGAGAGAGAGKHRQQPRMIGRQHHDLGDRPGRSRCARMVASRSLWLPPRG